MNNRICLLLFLVLFSLTFSCGTNSEFRERDSSHVLINPHEKNTYAFLGNSITHDGRYHSYFELFLLTRYPDVEFQFINAGVAGDQAGIALGRLEIDLLDYQPDLVTVMFGMNDIGRGLYGKENLRIDSMVRKQNRNILNYSTNLDSLTKRILDSGSEVILFTPSIYEQEAKELAAPNLYGCNDALGKCALIVKEVQKQYDTYLVDQYSVMDSINLHLQKENPDTTIVGPDRVHPQDVGHFIMAANMIEQLAYSPLVSSIDIDIVNKKIVSTNAEIDRFSMNEKLLKFEYTPGALPFPTKKFTELANLVNFNEKMNREILTIKGLPDGEYRLRIDSTEITSSNAKTLSEGVNLCNYQTPQHNYALEIARLVEQKREIISGRLRNLAFIEYFYAPKVQSAKDSFETIQIIDDRLQQDEGKSYYGYLEGQVKLYKEVKYNLPEIMNKIDALNLQIHELRASIPTFEVSIERIEF